MQPRAVDWDAIHRRLAVTAAAISGGLNHGPVEARRILQARARAAARPPVKPDDAERLEILAFSLAGETYGVQTCHVREVCQLKDLTEVPCTPSFVAGVMNLRGQILAIVDLRKFFGLPARGLTELNRTNLAAHFLHAAICHELGRIEEAIAALGKVFYLDQDFILAHHALGGLFKRLGKRKESRRHLTVALDLLAARSRDEIVPESDGMTCRRLVQSVRAMTGT